LERRGGLARGQGPAIPKMGIKEGSVWGSRDFREGRGGRKGASKTIIEENRGGKVSSGRMDKWKAVGGEKVPNNT